MSSRTERFSANQAIFWSGVCCCFCVPIRDPQFLDVRVRNNGAGTARVDRTLITIYQGGTNNQVDIKMTDDLGDAIFRLPAGQYDVRAQKAWHVPDDQRAVNQALADRGSTIVRFNKQLLQFCLHVDGDRDGDGDPQPEAPINTPAPAWAWGANRRGAIILCNNDNDGLPNANDPDNTDNAINAGNDDTLEIAHLQIQRHGANVGVPHTWTAGLSITSPAGAVAQPHPENHVRIFDGATANDPELLGAGTQQAAVPNFPLNPLRTFGMEAIDFAGAVTDNGPPKLYFDGVVTVRLTISCPNPLGGANLTHYTEAQLRVAPWLMPTHLDRPQHIYVSNLGAFNDAFRNGTGGGAVAGGTDGLAQYVAAAQDANGHAPGLTQYLDARTLVDLGDPWMQDCMEIGYSNFPGNGNGGARINSYMKARRNQGPFDLKHYPLSQLAPEVGHSNPSQDAFTRALAVPGGAAVVAASAELQAGPFNVAVLDADAIVAAAAAPMAAGTRMTDCVAAAASRAAAATGAPTVAAAVSTAVGIAAIDASVAAHNAGAANPGAVYAAALAAAGGGGAPLANVTCAQNATYAAEAITAAVLAAPGGRAVAGQAAAGNAAVAIGGGAAAPLTAGTDARDILNLYPHHEFYPISLVAHTVSSCTGVTPAQAEDATDYTIAAQWRLSIIATPMNTFDSTGNLEVTPPVRKPRHNNVPAQDYPWGRIYYGRGRAGSAFDPDTLAFLTNQIVQAPLALNTDWLSVGHVDEMMTFVPAPSANRPAHRQWKLLIASPTAAYAVLNAVPNNSVVMNARHLNYGLAQTTAGAMMGNANSTIPNPGNPPNVLTWEELRWWNTHPLQRVLNDIKNTLVTEIGLVLNEDVIEVPVVFRPQARLAGGGAAFDATRDPGAQNGINVLPGTAGGFVVEALTADMVNMLVLNNHLIIPKPFGPENPAGTAPVGADRFEADLTQKLQNANPNLVPHYLDDWNTYHANMGEVHCGTNTLRSPRPADVANWLTNDAKARWWEFSA